MTRICREEITIGSDRAMEDTSQEGDKKGATKSEKAIPGKEKHMHLAATRRRKMTVKGRRIERKMFSRPRAVRGKTSPSIFPRINECKCNGCPNVLFPGSIRPYLLHLEPDTASLCLWSSRPWPASCSTLLLSSSLNLRGVSPPPLPVARAPGAPSPRRSTLP
jgi:hypothetical protein